MNRTCSPDCICLACSERRRAVWYLGGTEDRFWRWAKIAFLTAVVALAMYVGLMK